MVAAVDHDEMWLTLHTGQPVHDAPGDDDVIRVADLKTRGSRHARVVREVGVKESEILYTTEFMHPRMEEVIGTMPERMGRWFEERPALVKRLDRFVSRGRRVRTGTIRWYLALYTVAGLKRMRLRTLRHAREQAHIDAWLGKALEVLPRNYALAVEIVGARRLVKGYSDTHARGEAKFDRVLSAVPMLVDRPDGGDWLRRLKQAALMDEDGLALDGALKTVASLDDQAEAARRRGPSPLTARRATSPARRGAAPRGAGSRRGSRRTRRMRRTGRRARRPCSGSRVPSRGGRSRR